MLCLFFFFKQKTAYEMRISDWSSDVCSSDLFRASGQTGIMIAGGGIPMDAVVSDFEAGAAELLSPDADADHWDIIEGQGALTHPAYAAVSLGLLHGSQPDVFVVCHEPGRTEMLGMPGFPVTSVEEITERSEEHTSELQSLMRISYAVFCLKKKNKQQNL